jgi:signal transduction histidine kinase
MKIQTQFKLLITGILIIPLLIILTQIVYKSFIEEHTDPSNYEEITALLDKNLHILDRKFLVNAIRGSSLFSSITIFSNDFLVLYSSIPEFTAGETLALPDIFALFVDENRQYAYSFESPEWIEKGYILIRRNIPSPDHRDFGPWFLPALISIILICALLVFAICMSLFIARSITKSVMVLEDATRRIAGGELDLKVDARGSNEITSLTNSLNKMRNALKEEELRRSRFIMGISHDLKTPLALIKGYAEAIQDGVTEDPASPAEIITAKADQLEDMINNLIDFVRIDTGEWRGQLKRINLTAFLRDFEKILVFDIDLLHHKLQSDIALPEVLFVPMDERLVMRALENLVNNAIRYTPKGSHIRLGAALVEKGIVLTLSDNGPGIAEADLPHIFELFYRGSSSRREQGMGLGLAVVKWVIDSHGWSIAVHSKQDGETGTCFTITIPS